MNSSASRSCRRLLDRLVVAAWLSLLPGWVWADWLDEMPDVARVVDAARAEWATDIVAVPVLKEDQEFFASRLAGTLASLRTYLELEARDERRADAQRRARIAALALSYARAEYVIGVGAGRRDLSACERQGRPARFATSEECHRGLFKLYVGNLGPASGYHQKIFTRVFCDDWKEHYDRFATLASSWALQSPSVTLTLPDGSAPASTAVCAASGGDADANGLCDAWERPFTASATAACGVPDVPPPAPCEQPRTDATEDAGLYGPFDSLDDAARGAWPAIKRRYFGRAWAEVGMFILKQKEAPFKYYVVHPIVGGADNIPFVTWEHYERGRAIAFQRSCSSNDSFVIAATAHSHPNPGPVDGDFSPADFQQGIQVRRFKNELGDQFESIVLFTLDGGIKAFEPRVDDIPPIDPDDPFYERYRARTRTLE